MSAEPLVYLGGGMNPASEAHIAIYDASVVLGATVTDMVRTFDHQLFRLQDHIDRFYRSCRYAQILPPIDADETVRICQELVQHNAALRDPDEELGLILFISPGEFAAYAGSAGLPAEPSPTYCIHTFPLPFHMWGAYYTEGVHVVTPSIRHVPPQCVDPKIKCRSRMHFWLGDQQTHLVDPKAVTLLLDLDGNITETSGSNFLIARDGTVISPGPRNILRGISITTVADLCAELGIPYVERDFQVYDVINADEAYLASTPYCLAPVTRINGVPVATGKPGPMLGRLLAAWSQRVGVDIVAQITGARAPTG